MATKTTTNDTNTISISVKVNPSEVFIATIGGSISYWVKQLDTNLSIQDIYDNNKFSNLKIKYENPDDETKTLTKTITTKQLCEAYLSLLLKGQTHCFGHQLNAEDYDSCFGDLVLQQALFGRIIFG